jgi:hypothetical protein
VLYCAVLCVLCCVVLCCLQKWLTAQISVFLDILTDHSKSVSPFSDSVLDRMNHCYQFGGMNAEIRVRWCSLCLISQTKWIVPNVLDFITTHGRMKYVRPLYRALNEATLLDGHSTAVNTFLKYKKTYVLWYCGIVVLWYCGVVYKQLSVFVRCL